MTIRVLHIIGSLRLGGAQVCLKHLVEHPADPEIEHYVYPLRSKDIDISVAGHVIRLPYRNYDPRKFFAIFSLCKKHRIDLIHAHLHKAIIAALTARFFMHVPVIVHEHGSIACRGFQYALYRVMLRLLWKKACLLVAVSKSAASLLTQYAGIPPANIRVVHNAVDTQQFAFDAATRKTVREQLGLSDGTCAIGYAGRLSYEKGPDLLLEAFGLLAPKHPDCVLIYLGDGTTRNALEARAAELGIVERVRFLGFRENAAEMMHAFDIGCVPSRLEAFGITAVEMMSLGIPLVCSNVSGLAEIVSDGHNALVPAENTPAQISRCIEQLMEDQALRAKLVQNGKAAAQQFDVTRLVRQFDQIYRSAAQSR